MALKVPTSLSERTVIHSIPRDPVTGGLPVDAEASALIDSVRNAREEAEKLAHLEQAAIADRTQTHDAAAHQVAAAAEKIASRVAGRLEAARDKALGVINAFEKATAAPPPPSNAVELALESDIRRRLAEMGEKQRTDALAEAVERGDTAVIGAVLRGPAFLSGVKEAQLLMLRHKYRERYHPEQYRRVGYLRKAVESAERAGKLFFQLAREAKDSPKARLAEANRRAREEALAAVQAQGD